MQRFVNLTVYKEVTVLNAVIREWNKKVELSLNTYLYLFLKKNYFYLSFFSKHIQFICHFLGNKLSHQLSFTQA